MKRRVAALLTVVMMATSLISTSMTAMAAELWTAKEPAQFKKGDEEEIKILGGKGKVLWARVEPEGVVKIDKTENNIVKIRCLNVGKTVMTVFSQSLDENDVMIDYKGSINITVTDETGIAPETLGVAATELPPAYRVEVGKSTVGQYHKTITTEPTVDPAGILTAVKKQVSVTNNANNNSTNGNNADALKALGISNANYYQLEYTGLTPGRATVTYFYTDDGDSSSTNKKATVLVEVLAAGTMADSAASATANVSLDVGGTSTLSKKYHLIKDVSSSSPSIVKTSLTGSTGTANITFEGLKAGTSTVSFKYQEKSGDPMRESKITFTVRGDDKKASTTSDISSGIYLTPRKTNVSGKSVGKSYFTNLRINGEKIASDDKEGRKELLWISTAPSVASIDTQTGEFTIKGKGTTKIVCISKDGKMMDTVSITVK